ncbi:MAG TPA: nicotinate (nicotinamide) nucleotide adenylyltransferase [Oscillospiraceae bacterium]|nr:nicotinate (nicotinamide) nucleotide adenylyltransferase [Oscillospiraceae bacterium]
MKTGIFGGSFDPVHNGHINAAKTFLEEMNPDRLLIIPNFLPPHKDAPQLAPAEDRLAMCRIAFAGDPRIEVSDLEIRRGGPSYTSDTLEELSELYPEDEFCLLVGGDMLLSFEDWHDWHRIAERAVLVCVPRTWEEESALTAKAGELMSEGAEVRILPTDVCEISSTQIREKVREGEDISYAVPEDVAEYIWEHGLYCL